MIRPGIAPIYVRRCPRISASSRIPPSETLTYLRSSAFAMLAPILVLPVPGAPTKHRIDPACLPFKRITAICCKILFFTFSSPAWSASSTRRDSSIEISCEDAFFHGRLVRRSNQSVSIPASGLLLPSPFNLRSTFRPSFRAASFIPASSSLISSLRSSVTFSGCISSSSF